MNDFFLASDRNVLVVLDHNNVTVNQLKMHNFDQWSGHAQAIKEFLKIHPDDIAKLLQEKTAETLGLISLSIDRDAKDIERIMLQEQDRSFDLINAVIVVNDAFFDEREDKKEKHDDSVDPRIKTTWFDSFQLLISNGHTNAEIMQMTYGAFKHYLKAAQKAERRKMVNGAITARAAQHAAKKAFDDFTKNLSK